MSCEKASTSSSCAPVWKHAELVQEVVNPRSLGEGATVRLPGVATRRIPASTIGNAAWARAYFPPSGMTGMMHGDLASEDIDNRGPIRRFFR